MKEDCLQHEPEFDVGGGSWDGVSVCFGQTNPTNNLSSQMFYSLAIGGNTDIDQVWGVRVSDVNDFWIPIGRLKAKDIFIVDQNYYFDKLAEDKYQGDRITINITFYADQVNALGLVYTTGVFF